MECICIGRSTALSQFVNELHLGRALELNPGATVHLQPKETMDGARNIRYAGDGGEIKDSTEREKKKKQDLFPPIVVENAGVVANKMDELTALAGT